MKEIPNKSFGDLVDAIPPLERILFYSTGLMLVFFFAVTFIANPSISGFSVAGAATQDTSRFAGTTSILMVVFAVFALFIFMVTKRLRR